MSESFFDLSETDRDEALGVAASVSGRPAYLLEKDVWVVWTLATLFGSSLGDHLSFKGGTSLSKVYGIIDRFSEDIDVTYDIRSMIPDMASQDGIPPSRSQGSKWTEEVRKKLPLWIEQIVEPLLSSAAERDGLSVTFRRETKERLYIDYSTRQEGYGYVKPAVMIDFGARSTGEPTEVHLVNCDAAAHVPLVTFPSAAPRVLKPERTFWEKATAAHVFCVQGELKGERFARHWHDLVALSQSERFESAMSDGPLATSVALHKSFFFRETGPDGSAIDYAAAVTGKLRLVPEGAARTALEDDYNRMIEARLLHDGTTSFEKLMDACQNIEARVNAKTGGGNAP